MKWWIYVLSAAIVLAAFPLSIVFSKSSTHRGNVAGATMMIGFAFMTIFDPKSAAAIEMIQRRKEIGEEEGNPPGADP